MTGLVLLPVHITNNRSEGYDESLRTLPVNRAAILLADTTIWLLITLPGILISMLVTSLMFAPGYVISPWFLLTYLLCGLTCVVAGCSHCSAALFNAKLMRSSLAMDTFEFGMFDMIKVSIWCILGFAVAIRILNKK